MPSGNQWGLVSACGTFFLSPFPAEVVCKSMALNSDERQFRWEPGVKWNPAHQRHTRPTRPMQRNAWSLRGRSPRYIFLKHTHQSLDKCIYLKYAETPRIAATLQYVKLLPVQCPLTALYRWASQSSQLLNPDPGWRRNQRGCGPSVCNLERKALKQWPSSNVETGDALDADLELQGGGYRRRDDS